ncbi:ATP-dependent DNA helicase MER3 [Sporothrix eucalyptigena]|uniref:ATP-dependent DNA helicase MER3 n=1 Tax=Sporothrix eucalyptigena TaxID=1812306 RepID=A0ABP0CH02_9PEZI
MKTVVMGPQDHKKMMTSPTGSGKTVIFELAICRLLATRDKKDFKIVYQAPTKALCSERTRDWQDKFKPLGLQVAEFTGDTSAAEVRRARWASVIITTPEKWDSITRKWSDHGALLKTIKLVLIDEVHILKDTRGATLETVVSRMKTLGSEVRFVALSATIPNSIDIAQWVGLTHTSPQVPAKTFVCGDEFRPVRLEKIVIGYNVGGGNEHSFDSLLDSQLPNLIVKHAQGKPVLIFCFTRKSTESAAAALSEYWNMCPPTQKPWQGPTVAIRSSTRLQPMIASGVAFHHGGLERQDRASIEEAFLRGHLSIVCCTSTLAVGVNLPCHTVILKGTMGYQNGKFSEYDEFEVMQMIGRAGRPQFDTSATAIILTRTENRDKYLNIESSYSEFRGTQYGSAMSTYMVRFETMVMMLGFNKTITMEELVNGLCHASEFDELRVKSTERQVLRELNKSQDIPFKFKDNIMETWQKISVLIQVELSRGTLPYQHRMSIEAKQAIERMQRLLESYIACMIADSRPAQLCQVPDIGPVNMKKLVDKDITTVLALADLGTVSIERFLIKNPPAAMKIVDSLKSFPRLFLDGQVAKAALESNSQVTEEKVKAIAKVKFGCTNEQGLSRWRNKVPSMTFLAMTKEGTLLHIWRGKLQCRERDASFPVPHSDADSVLCYFTCDDIVGTIYSLQLPSIEVPRRELSADGYAVTAHTPVVGPKTKASVLRDTAQTPQPKRQRLLNYSTQPITVGDTVIDCIDLSAVDEAEAVLTPPNKRKRTPMPTNSVTEDHDSYGFQSMSVKKPRNFSGGGTQQDPFTLDDSDSDDFDTFDTDIFDNIEMPTIKESPQKRATEPAETLPAHVTPQAPVTYPKPVFTMRHIETLSNDTAVPETRDNSPETAAVPAVQDSTSRGAAQDEDPEEILIPPLQTCQSSIETVPTLDAAETTENGEEQTQLDTSNNVHRETRPERDEPEVEGPGSVNDESMEAREKPAEEAPKLALKAPFEPSWVTSSSSSIVDFLRGHVKFV